MAAITSSNVATAIAKLIATDAAPALVGNLVMGNLINRNYEPTLASQGDTVNVPIPPVLVANNISEGGSVATQNPNLGNAQLVIDTHLEATFTIPDATKALAHPELINLYMQPAIIALAEKIESLLLAKYTLFTSNTALGTAGNALTEAVLDNAETALFNAKVPAAFPRFLVVSGSEYGNLRQLARFSEFDKYGSGDTIITGDMGKVKGFNVFRSQFVTKTGTSPVDTHNVAFVRDALMLVTRQLPQPITGAVAQYGSMGNFGLRVVMSYAPNTLAQQFTVDCLLGIAALRESFGIHLHS